MDFLYCVVYLLITGIVVFAVGRIYPRKWIKENKFPFKSFKFENDGKIYEKIKIKSWKTKLPDASVIINKMFPRFMPIKRIKQKSLEHIKVLVKESCVAETTHLISALLGFGCRFIWKKKYGSYLSLLYLFLNIPFIIIQRYNRPRLQKVLSRSNAIEH